jgi:hypothetical protein
MIGSTLGTLWEHQNQKEIGFLPPSPCLQNEGDKAIPFANHEFFFNK